MLSSYDEAGNRRTHAVGVPAPIISNTSTFSVSTSPTAVSEGSAVTFTVSRIGIAPAATTVNYAAVAGSASASSDFAVQSGTLTFRHWETVRMITVQTLTDITAEPVESFTLQLSGPSGGAALGVSSATANIAASGGITPNAPSTTANDSTSVGVCLSTVKNVIANDSDPEGNVPLALVAVTSSALGEAYVADSSSVGFTAYGGAGSTSVTYTVRDSLGATATGVLAISVTNGQGCN